MIFHKHVLRIYLKLIQYKTYHDFLTCREITKQPEYLYKTLLALYGTFYLYASYKSRKHADLNAQNICPEHLTSIDEQC